MRSYYRRYTVFIDGFVMGAFETEEEARDYIRRRFYEPEIASIWDNETRNYLYTEVRI